MRTHFQPMVGGAARWVGLLLVAACRGTPALVPDDPTATPKSPPLPMSQVFVLESWGAPAEDTVVRFPGDQPRIILLRRGSPDNNIYARLTFPAGSLVPREPGDSVTLVLNTPPGLYGLDLATSDQFRAGALLTFSYGIHFVAPAGARVAYGTDYRFERFLAVGQVEGDSTVVFLDSWRPASDMLTAPITGEGQYLIAAPRAAPRFRAITW